jgi:hypothetical protein
MINTYPGLPIQLLLLSPEIRRTDDDASEGRREAAGRNLVKYSGNVKILI